MRMKPTGIIRQLDSMGRIVLPSDLRKNLDLGDRDAVEFFADDGMIILRKYQPACVFCGGTEKLFSFKGKNVCTACAEKMHLAAENN